MYKIIVFIFLMTTMGYTNNSYSNKKIVDKYFSQDECLNINENYICVNLEKSSNKLKKIANSNINTKNPFDFTIDFTAKDIRNRFFEKLQISEKKLLT